MSNRFRRRQEADAKFGNVKKSYPPHNDKRTNLLVWDSGMDRDTLVLAVYKMDNHIVSNFLDIELRVLTDNTDKDAFWHKLHVMGPPKPVTAETIHDAWKRLFHGFERHDNGNPDEMLM